MQGIFLPALDYGDAPEEVEASGTAQEPAGPVTPGSASEHTSKEAPQQQDGQEPAESGSCERTSMVADEAAQQGEGAQGTSPASNPPAGIDTAPKPFKAPGAAASRAGGRGPGAQGSAGVHSEQGDGAAAANGATPASAAAAAAAATASKPGAHAAKVGSRSKVAHGAAAAEKQQAAKDAGGKGAAATKGGKEGGEWQGEGEGEEEEEERLHPQLTPEMALEVRRRRAAFGSMLVLLEKGAGREEEMTRLAAPLSEAEMLQVAEERALAGRCGNPLCCNSVAPRAASRARYTISADEISRVEGERYCCAPCEVFLQGYARMLGDPMERLRPDAKQQLLSHMPRGSGRERVAAQVNGVTTMLAEVKERDASAAAKEAREARAKLAAAAAAQGAGSAGAVEGYVPKTKGEAAAGKGGNGGPATVAGAGAAQAPKRRDLHRFVEDISAPASPAGSSAEPSPRAQPPSRSSSSVSGGGGDDGSASASESQGAGGSSGKSASFKEGVEGVSSLAPTSSGRHRWNSGAAPRRSSLRGGAAAAAAAAAVAEAEGAEEQGGPPTLKKSVSFARGVGGEEGGQDASSAAAVQEFIGREVDDPAAPVLVFSLAKGAEEDGVEGSAGFLEVADAGALAQAGLLPPEHSSLLAQQQPGKAGGAQAGSGSGSSGVQGPQQQLGSIAEHGEAHEAGAGTAAGAGPAEAQAAQGGQGQEPIPRALRMWFPAAAGGLGIPKPKEPAAAKEAGTTGTAPSSASAPTRAAAASAGPAAAAAAKGSVRANGVGAGAQAGTAAGQKPQPKAAEAAGGSRQLASSNCTSASTSTASSNHAGQAANGEVADGGGEKPRRLFAPTIGRSRQQKPKVVMLDAPPDRQVKPSPTAAVARLSPAAAQKMLPGLSAPASSASATTAAAAPASAPAPAPATSSSAVTASTAGCDSLKEMLPFEDPAEVAAAAARHRAVNAPKVVHIASDLPPPKGPVFDVDPDNGWDGAEEGSDQSDQESFKPEGSKGVAVVGSGSRSKGAPHLSDLEEEDEESESSESSEEEGSEGSSEAEWSDADGEFGGVVLPGSKKKGQQGSKPKPGAQPAKQQKQGQQPGKAGEKEEEGEEEYEDEDDSGPDSGYSSDTDPNYRSAAPFFGAPPKGYRVELSPFNLVWSLLSAWLTRETISYMTAAGAGPQASASNGSGPGTGAGGSSSRGNDSAAADAVLESLPLPDPQQVAAASAFVELLSPHILAVCTDLRVKVSQAEISKKISSLVRTLVFPGPIPSLSQGQWRLLALAILRSLSLARLPALGPAFEAEAGEGSGEAGRTRLAAVLKGTGFELPYLSALVDLLVST